MVGRHDRLRLDLASLRDVHGRIGPLRREDHVSCQLHLEDRSRLDDRREPEVLETELDRDRRLDGGDGRQARSATDTRGRRASGSSPRLPHQPRRNKRRIRSRRRPPNHVLGQHGQQERLARINQIGVWNAATRSLHHIGAVVIPPEPLPLVAVPEVRLRDVSQTIAACNRILFGQRPSSSAKV